LFLSHLTVSSDFGENLTYEKEQIRINIITINDAFFIHRNMTIQKITLI